MELELFADDEEVERLEMQLAAAGKVRTVGLLLPVAWQMRQRDPLRALTLADEAERTLTTSELANPEHSSTLARLQLLRAEVHWMYGELDCAQLSLDAALTSATTRGDAIGMGDCQWVAASIWVNRGDLQQRSACLRQAQDNYEADGESIRLAATKARVVFYAAFTDPVAARLHWQAQSATEHKPHPLVQAWLLATEGIIESLSGNNGVAARALLRAYEAMRHCGNLVMATNCAVNAGDCFIQLNDLAAALEWSERALALAQQIGNPAQIALSCANIAHALRCLKRPSEAQTRLQEAREALAHLPAHPSHVNMLETLAELALEIGDAAGGLGWATECEERAIITQLREGQVMALRLQARALGRLGRLDEALSKVGASLAMGQESGNASWQMEALRILAELHRQHPMSAPVGMRAPSAALHYVEEALTLARAIEGFLVPPDLLDEAAADYAAVGDTAKAYALSLESKKALVTIHSRDATDRAIAMQVQREIELMQAEMLHTRQLNRAENSRLTALEQANTTLEGLGAIGREITASLNTVAVFESLYRNVQGLLDAFTFWIYFVDAACENQTLAFGIEGGRVMKQFARPIGLNSAELRCIHERDAVVVEWQSGAGTPIPGTTETLSAMFAPLMVGERVLGILTIQSPNPGAYRERELAIFKSLAAYGAIALANAESFAALQQAQADLQDKNKQLEFLSATDRLTGLSNRLRLDAALKHELARCERNHSHWSLILLDVDKFKAVNDTHGHQVGDTVLVEVARVLSANVRKTDVLGRWGGEEFLIVCSGTIEQAAMLAEKLRAALERHDIAVAGPKTASFGVSSYRSGDSIEGMVARADAAMYRAKELGRNRVEEAGPSVG